MKFRQQPCDILKSLGIYSPQEINLDLIAYSLGAEVKRTSLSDCEGYIIGSEDRAIITINTDTSIQRQRFSLGHEIGHWVNDKKLNLTYRCNTTDMRQHTPQKSDFRQQKEVRANQFAAELLIPNHITTPYLADLDITFDSVGALAELFNVSRTSAAIRLVELSPSPCMLICYDRSGSRRWFSRNHIIPEHFWPHKKITPPQATLISGVAEEVDADAWIDEEKAISYSVFQSIVSNSYDILVLLWWKDEAQLLE